ncbi:MAG: sigma 54-interacting transcriptional regulator [Deltaproteobacteria bacterium]|nr:sigma 54-interacting transcriptional regulator [Deltaproteobacteria bacterium]
MDRTTDTLRLGEGAASLGPGVPGLVTLFSPGDTPPAILLTRSEVVLGREPPAGGVPLPFTSVSRAHAKISRDGEGWKVEDLESRNGTFVNGVKISSSRLADGDELRVGAVMFKMVARGAEAWVRRDDAAAAPALAALVGGPALAGVRREISLVGPSDLSVLVLGESGSGKELVARALHAASQRAGAFAAINCAAVPAGLLEAELFGAKRGAFTGLERDRLGIVRGANGGTLFLDEIGDMPLEAQAKLLRVLDTRQVTPLGSHIPESVDVRVICATHRNVSQLVAEERFRADLFARIAAHTIELPPLRSRKEDIPLLVTRLLEGATARPTTAFMLGLLQYDWPLNVRELETAIRRAIVLAADAKELDERHLPPAVKESIRTARGSSGGTAAAAHAAPAKVPPRTNAPPQEELEDALRRCGGNIAAVARMYGKDRAQIHRWLKIYGLSLDDFRY